MIFIYLMPFVIGISIKRAIIPARPITVPSTIFSHTIQKHIPTPNVNEPIIASMMIPTVLHTILEDNESDFITLSDSIKKWAANTGILIN